jgi:hypothetical protein
MVIAHHVTVENDVDAAIVKRDIFPIGLCDLTVLRIL